MMTGLLIFGFGGHARSVADIALAAGVREFCFVDSAAKPEETFMDFPVVREWSGGLPEGWQAFSASGSGEVRKSDLARFAAAGWPVATLIAPSATIGLAAEIGEGTLIAQHAHVGPMARIGAGCIINTGAIVDHESLIGEFSHISIHASVAGRVKIGRQVFLGAGSTVIDKLSVADQVTLGAGSVLIRSAEISGVYVGCPAQRLGRDDCGSEPPRADGPQ